MAHPDKETDLTIPGHDDVYVVGETGLGGWTSGGWDTTYNGDTDGFVARFSAMGAHRWSSFLGGTDADYAYGVVPDTFNGVHIVGQTASAGWLTGGGDDVLTGYPDGFTLWAK